MIQTTLRHWEYYGTTELFSNLYLESSEGETFNRLYDHIISDENILLAYRSIKSNKGSKTAGTDRFNIGNYKNMNRDEFINLIHDLLADYVPKPVKRTYIEKANGGQRPLGIPSMIDRLLQQMFKQVLEPICEAKFYKHSYGFRPLRTAHNAVARSMALMNRYHYHYCVDIDIKGFFDNVNHTKLMKQLWNIGIRDRKVLAIIMKMLKSPVKGMGIPNKGTPQGGILSPLLSNVVLNDLDHWVAGQFENFNINEAELYKNPRIAKYKALSKTNLKSGFIVRYADDFKIFAKDHKTAWRWFHAVKGYLKDRLGLNISPEKSGVVNLRKRNTEFLGFSLTLHKKGSKFVTKSNIRPKKLNNIKQQAKVHIQQISKNPTKANCQKFNSFVLGTHDYFKIATHVYKDLDKLSYDLRVLMHNRFKKDGKFERPKDPTPTYKKRFGKLTRKTWIIGTVHLFPIVGQQHQSPMNFSQELTPYTEEGRKILHKKINVDVYKEILRMSLEKYPGSSMEYLDNRISRYSMKLGKCEVSGIFLYAEDVQCHHFKPRHLGGTDEFRNLRIIHKDIHKLIHATKLETINSILAEFNFDRKQIEKINRYRKNCKLEEIAI
ncbi:group II intron reverse transcriptase/maturase [Cytobacillus sp. Bac17]|uniref:group II intron reverse transcriptase/maturase n=1 Tax=Cytobacillus sp. Bac17 TaxID=2926008 RepID=UPI002118152C|nr:group II intron reverse transcriptase/maturase [Cytobacillus sp. Bac17]